MPDDEILWPQGTHKPDLEKLFEVAKQVADEKTKEKIAQYEHEFRVKEKITEQNGDLGKLEDMPLDVLDGRLGEICLNRMLSNSKFPLAYAWPALLAVASTLAPRHHEKQRLNLYVALVGPVHSGKSQAIEWAQGLLGIKEPELMDIMVGSGEALMRRCKDANGAARLFSPDELGHLLEKAKIEFSSLPTLLTKAFYKPRFEMLMGKKETAMFNASLSLIGGLIDDKFDDLFSSSTTGGLYDRFAIGCCPGGFECHYIPFDDVEEQYQLESVYVHEDVWKEKDQWCKEDKELNPRIVEIAIRTAIICAAFDGKSLLSAKDLTPARAFADYQNRIRRLLKPNEGENVEGKVALKVLNHLARLGGKYVELRTLLMAIGAYRYGPSVANRAMDILHANGDIEITKTRPRLVRLILEEENTNEQ